MDEPKKVYIVTSGEYSGYGIECVFSDKDEATAFVDRHNQADGYGHYQVEEYVLDAALPVDRSGKVAFQVSYSLGQERLYFAYTPWYAFGEADRTSLPFEHVNHEDSLHMGSGMVSHRWETWVWAKDKQEALKLGADKIMPVLAEMQIEGVKAPEPEKPNPFEYMGAGTPFLKMMEKPESDFTIKVGKVEWGIRDGE